MLNHECTTLKQQKKFLKNQVKNTLFFVKAKLILAKDGPPYANQS